MASDWIKVRKDLRDDPAVIHIALRLKLQRPDVVGRLVSVWSWADSVTADGTVPGVGAGVIDELAGKIGFAEAMASAPGSPWLIIADSGLAFPHFNRHNGASANRRALGQQYQQTYRSRVSSPSASEHDNNLTDVSTASASSQHPMLTETSLDERREEKIHIKAIVPAAAVTRSKVEAHPETAKLCRNLGAAILDWQPTAKVKAESPASLKGMDGLLRIDGRDPEDVLDMLRWLFGSSQDSEHYRAEGRFDWRNNVRTGDSLRRHWDMLDIARRGEPIANGH